MLLQELIYQPFYHNPVFPRLTYSYDENLFLRSESLPAATPSAAVLRGRATPTHGRGWWSDGSGVAVGRLRGGSRGEHRSTG